MKVRIILPALGALCCCFSEAAHADLKWTEVMTFNGGGPEGMPEGMGKMSMSTNNWARKEATRTETAMSMGPIAMNTASIMHCDTKENLTLDPDLKMYAVDTTTPGGMPGMPDMGEGMPGMGGRGGAPGKGTLAMEISIQDLGTEKILDIDTHHYKMHMKSTATGCAGNGVTENDIETWVSNIKLPAPCMQVDYKKGLNEAVRMSPGCDVTTTYKGDTTAMEKAYSGLVMKMKMSGPGGKGGFTKEVTMLSQAELDDSSFAVPADWKKVTSQQLQQAKQQAMMKKMMAGMGGGGDEQ